jgi:hypothetical protein
MRWSQRLREKFRDGSRKKEIEKQGEKITKRGTEKFKTRDGERGRQRKWQKER